MGSRLRRPGGGVGAVIWPSLQQQHRPSGVLGQPVGEDAPSRAGADENRVVLGMGTVVHVRCDRPVTSMAAPEASASRPSSSRLLSMALVLVPRRIDLIAAIIRANWNRRSAPSVDKPRPLSSLAGQRYVTASNAGFSATANLMHAHSGHKRLPSRRERKMSDFGMRTRTLRQTALTRRRMLQATAGAGLAVGLAHGNLPLSAALKR